MDGIAFAEPMSNGVARTGDGLSECEFWRDAKCELAVPSDACSNEGLVMALGVGAGSLEETGSEFAARAARAL